MALPLLCSECFRDQGLRLDAAQLGAESSIACPNCAATAGKKLDEEAITRLSHRFFVWGTQKRMQYGAAPVVQFNKGRTTDIKLPVWLVDDVQLLEKAIGVGFFYYGPRLWMVGEVEPLRRLQDKATRPSIIARILAEYPSTLLTRNDLFYRVRQRPAAPAQFDSYDSPPSSLAGSGRLDSVGFPVMYGSQDLTVCIHECRITVDDEAFVATLAPIEDLKLLGPVFN